MPLSTAFTLCAGTPSSSYVVGTGQFHTVQFFHRGIVHDGEKRGQHLLSDFFREGLAFAFVALAMAFEPMSENFVEEHGGGAPGKHRRSSIRLGGRRGAQGFQVGRNFIDLGEQLGFRREADRATRPEMFRRATNPYRRRRAFRLHQQARRCRGLLERRTFAGGDVGTAGAIRQERDGRIHFGIFQEPGRDAANTIFPRLHDHA